MVTRATEEAEDEINSHCSKIIEQARNWAMDIQSEALNEVLRTRIETFHRRFGEAVSELQVEPSRFADMNYSGEEMASQDDTEGYREGLEEFFAEETAGNEAQDEYTEEATEYFYEIESEAAAIGTAFDLHPVVVVGPPNKVSGNPIHRGGI